MSLNTGSTGQNATLRFDQAFSNGLPDEYEIKIYPDGTYKVFVKTKNGWEVASEKNGAIPVGKTLRDHYEARIANEIKKYKEAQKIAHTQQETSSSVSSILDMKSLSLKEAYEILRNAKRGDSIRIGDEVYRYTAQSKTPWQKKWKKAFSHMDYIEWEHFSSAQIKLKVMNGRRSGNIYYQWNQNPVIPFKIFNDLYPEIPGKYMQGDTRWESQKTQENTVWNTQDTPEIPNLEDNRLKRIEHNAPDDSKDTPSDDTPDNTQTGWGKTPRDKKPGQDPIIPIDTQQDEKPDERANEEINIKLPDALKLTASIGDMQQAIEDRARQEAEEWFREQYNTSSWYKKPWYFFRRKGITDTLKEQAKKEIEASITEEQAASFAERAGREIDFNDTNNQNSVNTIEDIKSGFVDTINRFIKWNIDEEAFKKNIESTLKGHLAGALKDTVFQVSDIVRKAKNVKKYKDILKQIQDGTKKPDEALGELKASPYLAEFISKATGADVYLQSDTVKRYLENKKVLWALIDQKIAVWVQVIQDSKWAYQIDNRHKETGTYKVGKTLQNHPYLSALGTSGVLAGLSTLTGGIANIFGGGSLVGSVAGLRRNADMTDEHRGYEERMVANKQQIKTINIEIKNLREQIREERDIKAKKKLQKELKQARKSLVWFERDEKVFGKNTYEVSNFELSTAEFTRFCKKNKITNQEKDELIQAYKDYVNTGKIPHFSRNGLRILKIKEDKNANAQDGNNETIVLQHRKIIANATQRHFAPIKNLNTKLENYFKKETLSSRQKIYYISWIAGALARLDAGIKTGHNFLYSASADEREEDLDTLYRNIESGIKKLGLDLQTIRNNPKYKRTVHQFIEDYNMAHDGFMSKRTKSAFKTGIISGGLYGGTSTLFQWLSGTGLFESNAAGAATNPSSTAPKYTIQNGQAVPNTGATNSVASSTPTPSGANIAPTTTPASQISYGVDTGIADTLKTTLGDQNYTKFINELNTHNTPGEFWSVLNEKIFSNEAVTNQVKNEIMTYILNATDTVNGKEVPELVTEAVKNGVLDQWNFQKTLGRLAKWGYKWVDANWLSDAITHLADGTRTIAEFDSNQQSIIAEACFDAVHRDGVVGDNSPLWRVFMDKIETIAPSTDTAPVQTLTDQIPVEVTISDTSTQSSPWKFVPIGIPTWRNTVLTWWKGWKRKKTAENPPSQGISDKIILDDTNETRFAELKRTLEDHKNSLISSVNATLFLPPKKQKMIHAINEIFQVKKLWNIKNMSEKRYNAFQTHFETMKQKFIKSLASGYAEILEKSDKLELEEKKKQAQNWIQKTNEAVKDLPEQLKLEQFFDRILGTWNAREESFGQGKKSVSSMTAKAKARIARIQEGKIAKKKKRNKEIVEEGEWEKRQKYLQNELNRFQNELNTLIQEPTNSQVKAIMRKAEIGDLKHKIEVIKSEMNSNTIEIPESLQDLIVPTYIHWKKQTIFTFDSIDRNIVFVEIDGKRYGFYQSSKGTDGKNKSKWYPFYGGTNNWVVKDDWDENGQWIFNRYASPELQDKLKKASERLNTFFGKPIKNVPSIYATSLTEANNLIWSHIVDTSKNLKQWGEELARIVQKTAEEWFKQRGINKEIAEEGRLETISPEILEDFKNNMGEVTKNLYQEIDSLSLPTTMITVDDKTFLFPNRLRSSMFVDNPTLNKIPFFVKKWDTYETRCMRLSGSGGKWHTFPWFDWRGFDRRYSKWDTTWGLDYESGVITDQRLVNIIDSIPIEQNPSIFGISGIDNFMFESWYTAENIETKDALKEFEKVSLVEKWGQTGSLWNIWNLWNNRNEINRKALLKKYTPEELMTKFFTLPNFKLDTQIFGESLEYKGDYNTYTEWDKQKHELSFGEYDGKKVFARIAHKTDEPELCWVEEIFVKDSPITSFGIPKHRISGGLFTAKPKEYFGQIPKFIQDDLIAQNPNISQGSDSTHDIRKYLQGNPFIIKFKELRQNWELQ